jgi:hypothetical protein
MSANIDQEIDDEEIGTNNTEEFNLQWGISP